MVLKSGLVELKSFEEFQKFTDDLFLEYTAVVTKSKYSDSVSLAPIFFRGQADSSWELNTTLDRVGKKEESFKKYVQGIQHIQSRLNVFSGRNWEYAFKDIEFGKISNLLDVLPNAKFYHLYELFVYLRHHTYPSPLLDWTVSPYVAAFFAFDSLGMPPPKSGTVAIYCFIDTLDGSKGDEPDRGMITTIGPNFNSGKRHFLQQCRYTICLKDPNGLVQFAAYEDVFKLGGDQQDILIKITLPYEEKNKAINHLRLMNIGPYQLFESEDSLVRGLAYESFVPFAY